MDTKIAPKRQWCCMSLKYDFPATLANQLFASVDLQHSRSQSCFFRSSFFHLRIFRCARVFHSIQLHLRPLCNAGESRCHWPSPRPPAKPGKLLETACLRALGDAQKFQANRILLGASEMPLAGCSVRARQPSVGNVRPVTYVLSLFYSLVRVPAKADLVLSVAYPSYFYKLFLATFKCSNY